MFSSFRISASLFGPRFCKPSEVWFTDFADSSNHAVQVLGRCDSHAHLGVIILNKMLQKFCGMFHSKAHQCRLWVVAQEWENCLRHLVPLIQEVDGGAKSEVLCAWHFHTNSAVLFEKKTQNSQEHFKPQVEKCKTWFALTPLPAPGAHSPTSTPWCLPLVLHVPPAFRHEESVRTVLCFSTPHQKVWMPAGSNLGCCRKDLSKIFCFSWNVCYTAELENAQPYQHLKPSNSCKNRKKILKIPNHKETQPKASRKFPAQTSPPGNYAYMYQNRQEHQSKDFYVNMHETGKHSVAACVPTDEKTCHIASILWELKIAIKINSHHLASGERQNPTLPVFQRNEPEKGTRPTDCWPRLTPNWLSVASGSFSIAMSRYWK